jgi:hypothetical protein
MNKSDLIDSFIEQLLFTFSPTKKGFKMNLLKYAFIVILMLLFAIPETMAQATSDSFSSGSNKSFQKGPSTNFSGGADRNFSPGNKFQNPENTQKPVEFDQQPSFNSGVSSGEAPDEDSDTIHFGNDLDFSQTPTFMNNDDTQDTTQNNTDQLRPGNTSVFVYPTIPGKSIRSAPGAPGKDFGQIQVPGTRFNQPGPTPQTSSPETTETSPSSRTETQTSPSSRFRTPPSDILIMPIKQDSNINQQPPSDTINTNPFLFNTPQPITAGQLSF